MDYVKLYVTLRDDPKVVGLGDKAFRCYVNTLLWCGQHETDGLIADGLIPPKIRDVLIAAELVDEIPGGYVIHNYPGRQKTKAELEALRMARAMAGAKGADSRWHGKRHGIPIAEVEVEEEREKQKSKSKELSVIATWFEEFWKAYPRHVGKVDARKAYSRAIAEGALPNVILNGAARFRDDPNREDEFTPHPATWLNQGRWDDDPLPARNGNRKRDNAAEIVRSAIEDEGRRDGTEPSEGARRRVAGALPGA